MGELEEEGDGRDEWTLCVCVCVWLGKVKEATDRGVDWTEKSFVLFFPPESERL